MIEIHLTADNEVWTGQSTVALHAARAAKCDSVVLAAFGDPALMKRFEDAGLKTVRCDVGGIFGALNLSRVLRRLPGDSFRLFVHSPQVLARVESALEIVGRDEPIELVADPPETEFPAVTVAHPAPGSEPLFMWLGNITDGCGLRVLIEHLGANADRPWRLRVVGQGKAKTVSPVLKRCRALGIDSRIEWCGYSADPYARMDGVSAGIVTSPAGQRSVTAREFAAASIPTITNLSELFQ